MTVVVEVKLVFIDDKEEVIICSEKPYVDDKWLTIYPLEKPLSRRNIRAERVSEINWDYVAKEAV